MTKRVRPLTGLRPTMAGADRTAYGPARTLPPGAYVDRNGQQITVQQCAGMERFAGQDARLYVDPASVPVVDVRTWGDAS